jgi:hypothetical protein
VGSVLRENPTPAAYHFKSFKLKNLKDYRVRVTYYALRVLSLITQDDHQPPRQTRLVQTVEPAPRLDMLRCRRNETLHRTTTGNRPTPSALHAAVQKARLR